MGLIGGFFLEYFVDFQLCNIEGRHGSFFFDSRAREKADVIIFSPNFPAGKTFFLRAFKFADTFWSAREDCFENTAWKLRCLEEIFLASHMVLNQRKGVRFFLLAAKFDKLSGGSRSCKGELKTNTQKKGSLSHFSDTLSTCPASSLFLCMCQGHGFFTVLSEDDVLSLYLKALCLADKSIPYVRNW